MGEQIMKAVVTGAKGFIGKNLCERLKSIDAMTVCPFDVDTDPALLSEYVRDADIIYHLAGVNRPQDQSEYMEGNCGFTRTLLDAIAASCNTKATLVMSSSIQAELDNPYGRSKLAGEDLVRSFAEEKGIHSVIYRFPNVFGKWCRPNYNSVVATFCNNIARDLPILVDDPDKILHLVYIDDVIEELLLCLTGHEHVSEGFGYVQDVYDVDLGMIPQLLYTFRETRRDLTLPDFTDEFEKKLYSTYLSYLPENDFSYPLDMHEDERGSFTEFIKTPERGQVSVNISHPGIIKGNHWHNTKNEKFLVVSGEGLIRLRRVGTEDVIEYRVSSKELTVVDIPCGYVHSIENVGQTDMATVMWVNEVFDPNNSDTYREEV